MTVAADSLLARLSGWMRQQDSVLTAYSGGVDSAVVLAAAHRSLGDRALACIGISPSYPERELVGALGVARQLGARIRTVETQEHLDPAYAANPANRCYFCKSDLYTRLKEIAREEGFAVIVDGNNASDAVAGDRPGWLAGRERGIRSPLAELGFTKEQVRAAAKELGLPVWNKPAAPCLASRVPHGTPIVPGLLQKIERAENVLHGLGFTVFRVRHHQDIARIELPPEDFAKALALHNEITGALKSAEGGGYKFVTLDLAGFASGSLHAATK
ncbi:MAG TPA: ATP-dependent sacrificial sulfur transferase LarE [Phycisphaerae bacterium]|nr:ATP-dependent sacrificial sulfur transferase LarE [Phycisphaerae bacterium]